MISCDTNILFAACDADSTCHAKARAFIEEHCRNQSFCLCEQILMELYCLLRNPVVCRHPLDAADATKVIQGFRTNPYWRIVDLIPGHGIMDAVWHTAALSDFAYRRIFDTRLAAILRHHGVQDFATRNRKDFRDTGFRRVWDPTY